MNQEEKLKAYEMMQVAIQEEYDKTVEKMEQLKLAGKEKTVTHRQLLGKKLLYKNMLGLYEIYGL